MSRHDDRVSLNDMLRHAREAMALLGGRSADELAQDRVGQLALTRLVEVIGEAANRVSRQAQQRHAHVAWPQIIGMRNRLIDGYDVIDLDLLCDTVATDLPPLIEALEQILEEEV